MAFQLKIEICDTSLRELFRIRCRADPHHGHPAPIEDY